MALPTVDLTNCDIEPIHIPGKVQSHGFLVAVDTHSGFIRYVSENISTYTGQDAKMLLGLNLEKLGNQLNLNAAGTHFLFNQLINTGLNSTSVENLNPYFIEIRQQSFNVIVSLSGDILILEFEPNISADFDIQMAIGRSVSKILAGNNTQLLLERAVQEVRKIIGYDRVMIYKFGEDGHGQIIAEDKKEDLPPFLGLHYPASDIPKQARELYKINLTRIIADVGLEPSSIITDKTGYAPLDLTHSELRAVSPMHIQYLKNMGVMASFSISLLAKGELWGLVACHNHSPRFINYNSRESAKLIGHILSSALEFRQGEDDTERFEKLSHSLSTLIDNIDNSSEIFETITKNSITIKDIVAASGSALIEGDKINVIGETPDLPEITKLAKWLFSTMPDLIFTTHRLPHVFQPATSYSDKAGGIIACILSRELKEMLIWFKPEQLQKVHWAGNPEKPVELSSDGLMTLTPRKSFESWTEIVRNTSEKWSRAEIAAVVTVREHIIYAIKRKANEIRILNEKLVKAYDELDSFSYTVSHDLKTPLSSIKTYAELLLTTNTSLDGHARNILERICNCSDRMALLITEILHYSRVGRVDMVGSKIDMGRLLPDIWSEISGAVKLANIEFNIFDTPDIHGDKVMITQVFSNLLHNAIKYSARSNPSKVSISGKANDNEVTYSVTDNGIGIDINYYHKVFELFKRMDNAQDYEGTGVGLTIVKRIVERHGGKIWFESELGVGTTFFVTFKHIR